MHPTITTSLLLPLFQNKCHFSNKNANIYYFIPILPQIYSVVCTISMSLHSTVHL